jgi:hypothetical protein
MVDECPTFLPLTCAPRGGSVEVSLASWTHTTNEARFGSVHIDSLMRKATLAVPVPCTLLVLSPCPRRPPLSALCDVLRYFFLLSSNMEYSDPWSFQAVRSLPLPLSFESMVSAEPAKACWMGGRGFEAISNSANFGRTWKMFTRAALNTCSDGGIATARFVFSVRRVMKNIKRPVFICISAKLALPAGMFVCLLWAVSVENPEKGMRGCIRHALFVRLQYA